MSDFYVFGRAVNKQFMEMSKGELFEVGNHETADNLYQHYLASFPEGTNPIYKTRTEHDCSCCKQFIRTVGRVVSIKDGKVITVWDSKGLPTPYKEVAAAMAAFVRSQTISGVFRSSEPKYGAEETLQKIDSGVKKWNHFFAVIDKKHFTKDVGTVCGQLNTTAQVFKRGLEELSAEAIDTVLDLIASKALYRGEEHLRALRDFQKHKAAYTALSAEAKTLYPFENINAPATRFRNTVIGTLVTDLSEGVDLEQAVRSFEAKVAPTNYKRPTALITPAMVKAAMGTVAELGLESALHRRHARLSDVSVNNVLWVDNTVKSKMKDGFEDLLMAAAVTTVSTDKAEPITIDKFMADVLPTARSMDVFVSNPQEGNFVSITAPVHEDAGRLFKWDNPFGWSYDGNITDSIKEKVKAAGGNIEARLRFSLAWWNYDDLDIHVIEPCGNRIYFGNKRGRNGVLDVDMNAGGGRSRTPVENVAFAKPANGTYEVIVNQFSQRESSDVGFTVEVASDSGTKQYTYAPAVKSNVKVGIFTVENGAIIASTVNPSLSEEDKSRTKWGVQTEAFTKVNTVMYSPNYWDDNAVGNKHWFFILDGCKNDVPTRGIYNEFLKSDMEQHRKVFEVLGDKTKCQPADEQLSGVGFSSTKGDTLLVQVATSKSKRLYQVQF